MSDFKAAFYQSSRPEAEYLGIILLTLTQNLRADVILPVLKQHNMENIEADKWYPQQLVLNVIRDIERRFTFEELVAIGMRVIEVAPMPPFINTIEAALATLDAGHHATTRYIHPEEGIKIEKVSDTHFRVISNVPTPAFLAYGTVWGMARRFKGKGENPKIYLTQKEIPYVIEVKW